MSSIWNQLATIMNDRFGRNHLYKHQAQLHWSSVILNSTVRPTVRPHHISFAPCCARVYYVMSCSIFHKYSDYLLTRQRYWIKWKWIETDMLCGFWGRKKTLSDTPEKGKEKLSDRKDFLRQLHESRKLLIAGRHFNSFSISRKC